MSSLKKKIEDMMAAISFAEEGEFDTARDLMKEERRVLLALRRGQVDGKTFRYALNTCKRIGASLDILYVSSPETSDPALHQCLSELKEEGIDYKLILKSGCLKQEILEHTKSRKGILFVIIESSESMDKDCNDRDFRESWQKLRCPLVVVSEPAKAY